MNYSMSYRIARLLLLQQLPQATDLELRPPLLGLGPGEAVGRRKPVMPVVFKVARA